MASTTFSKAGPGVEIHRFAQVRAATCGITAIVIAVVAGRLAEGAVEFLYIQGRLAVVERVTPGKGGKSFVQRLTIENADLDVMLSLPERWREKIRASVGKWSGESLLKLKPEEAKAGVELTFDLAKAPEPPELNANWLKPGPPAPAAKTEDRQP